MSKKLYVGNLGYSVSGTELEQLFESHGTVESATVINDRSRACQPVPARLYFRQYRSSMILPLPRICPLARVHSPDKDRSLRLK